MIISNLHDVSERGKRKGEIIKNRFWRCLTDATMANIQISWISNSGFSAFISISCHSIDEWLWEKSYYCLLGGVERLSDLIYDTNLSEILMATAINPRKRKNDLLLLFENKKEILFFFRKLNHFMSTVPKKKILPKSLVRSDLNTIWGDISF